MHYSTTYNKQTASLLHHATAYYYIQYLVVVQLYYYYNMALDRNVFFAQQNTMIGKTQKLL